VSFGIASGNKNHGEEVIEKFKRNMGYYGWQ
jgi:hypothetical protein